MIWVRLVIPNRDDPSQPPTLYEEREMMAVPRVGEIVVRNEVEWIVKWVRWDFDNVSIDVRIIEPGHWAPRNREGRGRRHEGLG